MIAGDKGHPGTSKIRLCRWGLLLLGARFETITRSTLSTILNYAITSRLITPGLEIRACTLGDGIAEGDVSLLREVSTGKETQEPPSNEVYITEKLRRRLVARPYASIPVKAL